MTMLLLCDVYVALLAVGSSRGHVLRMRAIKLSTTHCIGGCECGSGRIFGGFLMRRAYELARSTAHLFGGRRPVFHELDLIFLPSASAHCQFVEFRHHRPSQTSLDCEAGVAGRRATN